jgi:hypothetical protein
MCIGNVCFLNQFMNLQMVIIIREPSWSWSYGNWIYNYAINAYHRSWILLMSIVRECGHSCIVVELTPTNAIGKVVS